MTPGWIRAASIVAAALLALGLSSATASDAQPGAATPSGPLGPADRDFLAKVRQAGLWELPTGQQSMEKSGNSRVKAAGMHLIDGHSLLDRMVRDTAAKLNVTLPDEPTSDQQGWLAELAAAEGTDYDTVFANRLRAAHGKVYGFAAQVRAGTRNTLVRAMATQTMSTVLDHIQMLEATGLVAFEELPSPTLAPPSTGARPSSASPAPAQAQTAVNLAGTSSPATGDGGGTGFLLFALILLLAPAVVLFALSRRRSTRERHRLRR